MKIEYKTGNLLDGPEYLIVHGANAQGVMKSGVAKTIRENYPKAYEEYRSAFEKNGLKLGTVIFALCENRIIANAITQEFYGRVPNTRYVDYDAVRMCMREINDFVKQSREFLENDACRCVAMPLIGAGLAQGSWAIISQIIEEESTDFTPVVYLLDGIIPTT